MFQWVSAFHSAAPAGVACRRLRMFSAVAMVVVFGLHGVIYLASLTGALGIHAEQLAYTCSGFFVKVLMSLIFCAIRTTEQNESLFGLAGRIHSVSLAFMSLLRGSFDYVVPCVADKDGVCFFPPDHGGDSAALESCLGRSVLGHSVNELIADFDQQRFGAHVKNVLRHADSFQSHGAVPWPVLSDVAGRGERRMPPVAQVLHVRLEGSETAETGRSRISAAVHISTVAQSSAVLRGPVHVVVGLCLAPEPDVGALTDECAVPTAPIPVDASCFTGAPLGDCERSRSAQRSISPTRAGSTGGVAKPGSEPVQPPESREHQKCRAKLRRRQSRADKMLVRIRAWRAAGRGARKGVIAKETSASTRRRKAPRDGESCFGTESSATESFLGGPDVRSQSSKMSCAGSVTLACRQLLGPLHDKLPPAQLVSKRIEDHVQCSEEMVRLRAPAIITKLHYETELAEWQSRSESRLVSALLGQTTPDEVMDEDIWRSHILPTIRQPPPGQKPARPDLPDDAELWLRAWKRTYEQEDSEGSD